ncbi:MAG: DUF4302 domain-containing protein [Muribaculaceae bacterium]|nr:DUF4302 domain-containing protein [Muribaculaceae bacterium]
MKTRKSIYLAALAALALTACSNDDNEIFDQSAADRLEQYKKDYADVLTADGGLWTMEYFSNAEEPGYVFVMKFDKNGSVQISANHKWIDGEFKQETSLWKMIADNGPVLSFNSYNKLFHIFSDPANIVGPDAPSGEEGDINETGYGHEGDYEFQVMEVSEDGKTVRLLGKKRLIDIFLHRLDTSVDVQEYLEDVKDIPNRFSTRFNDLTMTDVDGNLYRVYDFGTGIPSIYPLAGDAVSQTVSANGIFTLDGFRFMKPLEVKRADDSTFEIENLYFNSEGAMNGDNVEDLRATSPLENLIRADLTWTLDPESLSGKVKSLYDAANDALVSALTSKDTLGAIDFTYASVAGKIVPQLVTRIGTRICRDYIEYDVQTDANDNVVSSDQLHFSITGGNNTALKYDKEIPAYKAFKDYLTGYFLMTVSDPMCPEVIILTDKNDNSSSCSFKVKK